MRCKIITNGAQRIKVVELILWSNRTADPSLHAFEFVAFVCFLQTYIAINRTPLHPRVVLLLKKEKTTKEEKFFEFNSSCSPLQLRGFPRDPFSSPEFLFFPTFFQISSSSRFQSAIPLRPGKYVFLKIFVLSFSLSLCLSPSFFIARNVGKIWLVFFFFFYASMKFIFVES